MSQGAAGCGVSDVGLRGFGRYPRSALRGFGVQQNAVRLRPTARRSLHIEVPDQRVQRRLYRALGCRPDGRLQLGNGFTAIAVLGVDALEDVAAESERRPAQRTIGDHAQPHCALAAGEVAHASLSPERRGCGTESKMGEIA